MIKKFLFISLFGLFCFVLLETGIALITKAGYLNIIMPTYNMGESEDLLPERSLLYGHRHLPNSSYEVRKNCLHISYRFNSLGFRDEDHELKSNEKRVMVIGDSFLEGLGVEEYERLPDLLEKQYGITHINFAMADKGPTQAFVIYDSLGSKYDHDAVMVALFPVNDLIDDDPHVGKNANSIKPCWIGDYPNYKLEFVPKNAPLNKASSTWKQFLKTYTYTYDALFYLKERMKELIGSRANYPKTGYFDYTEEQLNRMKYALLQIKTKAKGKPLIVVCIPSHLDLQNQDKNKTSIENLLASFCQENQIEFIGLYNDFLNNSENPSKEFYYSCDSHWNPTGHEIAAKIVANNSAFYKSLRP